MSESEIKEYMANKRKDRKCCMCSKDLSGEDKGRRYYGKEDIWTGKYVCHKHHQTHNYHSQNSLKKLLALCRNQGFNIKRERCKGCIANENISIDSRC